MKNRIKPYSLGPNPPIFNGIDADKKTPVEIAKHKRIGTSIPQECKQM